MTENTKLKNILSNPLLLLLVGALVTGLLAPYITKQWQNQQKELEIKTDLLRRITQSVTSLLVTGYDFEIAQCVKSGQCNVSVGISNDTMLKYRNQYSNWSITSAVIESDLAAYFPESQISEEWRRFANLTTLYYGLLAESPPYRGDLLAGIQQLISKEPNASQLNVRSLNETDQLIIFRTNDVISNHIENQKQKIIKDILASKIPL
jgi:hypothetical protein